MNAISRLVKDRYNNDADVEAFAGKLVRYNEPDTALQFNAPQIVANWAESFAESSTLVDAKFGAGAADELFELVLALVPWGVPGSLRGLYAARFDKDAIKTCFVELCAAQLSALKLR